MCDKRGEELQSIEQGGQGRRNYGKRYALGVRTRDSRYDPVRMSEFLESLLFKNDLFAGSAKYFKNIHYRKITHNITSFLNSTLSNKMTISNGDSNGAANGSSNGSSNGNGHATTTSPPIPGPLGIEAASLKGKVALVTGSGTLSSSWSP